MNRKNIVGMLAITIVVAAIRSIACNSVQYTCSTLSGKTRWK